MIQHDYKTLEEWEELIGEQVRSERIAHGLDQAHLASIANISIGALSNLERGRGSSLKTLIAVTRVLDRTEWLQSLSSVSTISPIQMLRSKRNLPSKRMRVRLSSHQSKSPDGI